MHDLLCGKLLGDGCLVKQKGRKPRFQFIHCKKDKGWSEYCYEQLTSFIPLNPPKYRKVIDSRVSLGYTESYFVQSRTCDDLTRLYDLWYPHSKKELPLNYIETHFNEKSLAWWYQDDGHYKHQDGIPPKIILSTDSFSPCENNFLITLLQKRYSLTFSTVAQNLLVLYNQFQILYFLKIVEPYIHESMNRKKWIKSEPKKIATRTTIYLPSDIVITKPTFEIDQQYKKLPQLSALAMNHKEFFKLSLPFQERHSSSKPYQIQINEESKIVLELLKKQTGLNVSQLTMLCFRLPFSF